MFSKKPKVDLKIQLTTAQKQIEALEKVANAVTGVIDLDKVMDLVVSQLVGELGYLMPSIYLVDANHRKLSVKKVNVPSSVVHIAERASGAKLENIGFELSSYENILVRTAISGKIGVTQNFAEFVRPLLNESIAKAMQRVLLLREMIALPVSVKEEIFGVLAVGLRKGNISENEQKVLQTFANQISIAIYNAQLFERVQSQVTELDAQAKDLSSLLDVTKQAISSLDLEEVAQKIVDAVPVKLAHVEFVAGLMVDYDEKEGVVTPTTLTQTPATQEAIQFLKAPLTSFKSPLDLQKPLTLIGRTIATREIQMSDELSEFVSPYIPQALAKTIQKVLSVTTILSVPMVVRGAVVGVFIFFSKKNAHTITDRERTLAVAFANNMGLAIENARLYRLIEEKAGELSEKNAYLKQLDEAKSNFLSIASHQLRTPITAIKGYLSMLHEGDFGVMTPKQNEIIGFNLQNVERLVKLIDVFLDVSRIEAGRLALTKAETDLMPIIESVVQELSHEVERRGLYLTIEKPKKLLPKAFIDGEKMRHVILNLIDNAIKYTKQGGITVLPALVGKKMQIQVRDTGIGLKPEEAKSLFGKFIRAEGGAKINSNGSGLGLFIIKGLIEAHGGRVWVESDGEGKGSKFFVEFPIEEQKQNDTSTPKKR